MQKLYIIIVCIFIELTYTVGLAPSLGPMLFLCTLTVKDNVYL